MDFLLQYNLVLLKYVGEWTVAYPALYLTIALVLAIVLFIMIIVVAVRHSKNKKTIAALQAKANSTVDEAELRKQIRAELEAEYKNAASAAEADNAATQAQIDELNATVKQKQEQIDKLTAELEKANEKANEKPDNGNLYRTINELNQRVKAQDDEISKLKSDGDEEEKPAAKAAPKKSAPKKKAAKPVEPEPVEDEDDEEDYYDDEYDDNTSDLKVTVKFDRIRNKWVINRSDQTRAYRLLQTKQEAVVYAKDLASRLHAKLAVHKKDGKFQKV